MAYHSSRVGTETSRFSYSLWRSIRTAQCDCAMRFGVSVRDALTLQSHSLIANNCMIAKILPDAYDAFGRKTVRPDLRRRGMRPTFPMGRYVSQPLTVECKSLSDIRKFLLTCRSASDKEQFGREDYWQPPEHFERTKKGDCDDFALWTWRQFLALSYDARFVVGQAGRYGIGHAWVEFFKEGSCFLVEPQMRVVGEKIPRLTALRYRPEFSVAWDGHKISFYSHEHPTYKPGFLELLSLVSEWLSFWVLFWLKNLHRLPIGFYRLFKSLFSRHRPNAGMTGS